MTNVYDINWNRLEEELLNSFSIGRAPSSFEYKSIIRRVSSKGGSCLFYNKVNPGFRKVRIQFTRFGSICITTFPLDLNQRYRIFTHTKVQDFSLQNMRKIILLHG